MLKYSKFYIGIILICVLTVTGYTQSCTLSISGFISDEGTGDPIPYANLYIDKLGRGTTTDDDGYFSMESICPDRYHITISHVSCETRRFFLDLTADTLLDLKLDHAVQAIKRITISTDRLQVTTQKADVVTRKMIDENADHTLADLLDAVAGVSVLRTGSGIGKPVVQGLYGNRLTILNNGIAQSGQQWGNDHSPEIDPFVAQRVSVIKGVGVVEYAGNSLGSLILVEPGNIPDEPHIHGSSNVFYESNGRGGGINVQLHQAPQPFSWKFNGTLKGHGDKKSPEYYLRNSGVKEANVALQLARKWSNKWTTDVYASLFSSSIGILKGAHVGNLTDLEEAFEREVPFFTENKFNYDIGSPRQEVLHYLWKFDNRYLIDNNRWIELTYSGQINDREEYDVRRGGRSDIPALSLQQKTHFLEGKYQYLWNGGWKLKSGISFNYVDNTNLPETGVLPLIPDYRGYEGGWFLSVSGEQPRWSFQWGGRYDLIHQRVAGITRTIPREIFRDNSTFHNIRSIGGVSYHALPMLKITGNLGYASRNPAVNERFSNGLHQGVSGIEEGDPSLNIEKSVKGTISVDGHIQDRLFWESSLFYQMIQDYIYLKPQDEIRLTIRGAFPVFHYEQTDATIYGFDVTSTYLFLPSLKGTVKYSHLKGENRTEDLPLINMPSNSLSGALSFTVPKIGRWENNEIEINSRYVARQKYLKASQDYAPAPDSYFLAGFKYSTQRSMKSLRLNLYLKIENLLDVRYRDYLNRQRYFSDAVGRSFTLGGNLSF